MPQRLRVGSQVRVPWGYNRDVDGEVIEVWGDPPTHVRVRLRFEEDDQDDEPVILLLSPAAVQAA